MANKYNPGDKITTSGQDGTVLRYYSAHMVEVRLPSGGVTCVDECDIRPTEESRDSLSASTAICLVLAGFKTVNEVVDEMEIDNGNYKI